MSLLLLSTYKGEDNVHHNPPVDLADQNTHADVDGKLVPKTVSEVLIKWVTSAWVVQSVFSAGTVVATQTKNPSDGTTAWYNIPLNDFIAGQCCATPDAG